MKFVLSSKIFRATVTEANLEYEGSITIDTDLCDKSGIWIGEKVLVVSNTTGARLETYVIPGKSGSGIVCMNGAAAHLIKKGDEVIIMGFTLSDKPIEPKIVFVNEDNKIAKVRQNGCLMSHNK
ncbi:MAG: aspartate 1-decarboxylase [Endomicrobium sp.]|jgi:aspartate 1-decarboxylase|nr:aspartate 1-decarboxylase [Endomicrobium sp.]